MYNYIWGNDSLGHMEMVKTLTKMDFILFLEEQEVFLMIQLTERDKQIIQFLKEVSVADTKSLSIIFFNSGLRRCQQRLKLLCEYRYIKSFREDVHSQYIYYVGRKTKNWQHKIVFSQLLAKLYYKGINILKYKTPLKVNDVIADGFIAININGVNKIYLVEVDITKYFDLNKYMYLYFSDKWKEYFPVFPSILAISNKRIDTNETLDIKTCKLDLLDLTV